MLPITPFLSFETEAEDAARLYISVFPDAAIRGITRYPANVPQRAGQVMTVDFVLNGQPFVALNGGPAKPTMAVSFLIRCDKQEEIDRYWNALSEGGTEIQCGWLTDRFGVTWQVVPNALTRLLSDPDPGVVERVVGAMMQMRKFDIAGLEQAAAK